ncbi:MAG TPA: site-specific integrase [Myxococcaceae bacterium]|nr:site-specific integrase [Myxococcaceae bacterium]
MCKEELLVLRWEQVNLEAGTVTLAPEDTKTDEPRLIVLTARAKEAVAALHTPKATGYVFRNPKTKTRWVDVKKRFQRAVKTSELHGLWFHDLRRSFITRARRVGVPESVVMRMSGHRTRAVFETARWVRESWTRLGHTPPFRGPETPKPHRRKYRWGFRISGVAGAGFEPATFGL